MFRNATTHLLFSGSILKTVSQRFMSSLAFNNQEYSWSVVGAGPGGIAAVGKLIDSGVKPNDIAWIDPHFDVGLLGRKWRTVSSNTKVSLFINFLMACDSYHYKDCPKNFEIHSLNGSETCALNYIVEPLEWVTEELKKQVQCHQDIVINATETDGTWHLETKSGTIKSKKVVLAIGSKPKEMTHETVPTIPLDKALQINELYKECGTADTIAVFGSSHSAIMIVRDLLARPVQKVINFYRSPLIFAEYLPDGGIVHDSTGLKGKTAQWAKENMTGDKQPENLEQYVSDKANIDQHLGECAKVIYAIGFDREDFKISGLDKITYNAKTGEIDGVRGAFGVGIAFPELAPDAAGNMEYMVGLWKFMRYLNKVVPLWLESS